MKSRASRGFFVQSSPEIQQRPPTSDGYVTPNEVLAHKIDADSKNCFYKNQEGKRKKSSPLKTIRVSGIYKQLGRPIQRRTVYCSYHICKILGVIIVYQ